MNNVPWDFMAVLFLAGSLGGVVRAIVENDRTENCITIPLWNKQVALGFAGDVLIGGCTSLVGYTFFNVLTSSQGGAETITVKLVGFGIACGYAGTRILNAALDKILAGKVAAIEKKAENANLKADAVRFYASKQYAQAAKIYQKIVDSDPSDSAAKLNLALSLSYTGAPGEEQALKLLEELVASNSRNSDAWYNIACIRAVATFKKFDANDVLTPLKKSLELDPSLKDYPSKDEDFDDFREEGNSAYAELTGDTGRVALKKRPQEAANARARP